MLLPFSYTAPLFRTDNVLVKRGRRRIYAGELGFGHIRIPNRKHRCEFSKMTQAIDLVRCSGTDVCAWGCPSRRSSTTVKPGFLHLGGALRIAAGFDWPLKLSFDPFSS